MAKYLWGKLSCFEWEMVIHSKLYCTIFADLYCWLTIPWFTGKDSRLSEKLWKLKKFPSDILPYTVAAHVNTTWSKVFLVGMHSEYSQLAFSPSKKCLLWKEIRWRDGRLSEEVFVVIFPELLVFCPHHARSLAISRWIS